MFIFESIDLGEGGLKILIVGGKGVGRDEEVKGIDRGGVIWGRLRGEFIWLKEI